MQREHPFGLRDKVGYLLGDLGNDFTFILSSSFLLKFYTDVMGVPGAAVGFVMMAARFVDAFTDVAMGRICDRSPTTDDGKFKPWLRRMAIPVAAASFLMYPAALAGQSTAVKVGWLFVTYIFWGSICYTAANIPYGSMASAISAEPGDRQSLSTWRTMGGTVAGLAVGALVPLLAYDGAVLNGRKFTVISAVFSVLAVICYYGCSALTTERIRLSQPDGRKQQSLGRMLRSAAKNRALISIIAASVVMLLSQLTMQSMANYVYPNFYRSTAAQSASTIVMVAAMSLAAAFARPLAQRFGKAEVSVASNLLAAVVCIVLYFLRPENVWVYVAFTGLNWLGLGVFGMVTWALITDVIDDAELRSGVRQDGSVYALYSFARKLGQAAAAGISGWLLSAIGYTQETAFEPSVVNGIYDIAALIPALGFALLAVILWFWYPLRKARVEENALELKRRREQ